MNRVEVGFFSLTRRSPSGDDQSYLSWHQLDHMPEQYRLAGMVLGQRWASTTACRAARAAEQGDWSEVEHAVCYLMGAPVGPTIDEFFALGRQLADQGRFSRSLPSQYRGALRLLGVEASSGVPVSPAVVPFRPHRGIYLMVERLPAPPVADAAWRQHNADALRTLVAVPGVAGAWTYATDPDLSHPMFTEGQFQMTVCYLDGEPAVVAERLGPVATAASAPHDLVLAAPLESLMCWDWERFGPPAH